MTIRAGLASDVAQVASLIRQQHQALHVWQPELWPLHEEGEAQQAAHLQARFGSFVCSYVAETPQHGGLDAAILVSVLGGASTPTWIVDEMVVAEPTMWTGIGAILLARVAADAHANGIDQLVVSAPSMDAERIAGFRSAGVSLGCWFRHRRITDLASPEFVASDSFEPGLPLPHLHGLAAATAAAKSITSPGAHSLLSPRLAPPTVFAERGTFRVADPVIANDEAGLWGALNAIEQRAQQSGDSSLLVVIGPGEEPLDEMAERRGYERVMDWGVLTVAGH